MTPRLNRRCFLGLIPAGIGAASLSPVLAGEPSALADSPVGPEFPTTDPALVREIVAKAHTDFEKVKEIVTSSPELAKAAWDWGFGDWESALGAASHMGRRDIAEILIEHGARPNLFTHAMLGDREVVQAAIQAQPGIQRIPGPHGITLLQHAKSGGEDAKATVAYLASVGDADIHAVSLETTDEQKQLYLGRYVFGTGEGDVLEVITNRRGDLAIRRGERFGRVLNRVEENGFAPGGAASVRVRFRVEDGRVVALSVHDPHPLVTARRID